MDLLALLGTSGDGADHAWVLRHALSYLERIDTTLLIVAVLESGGRDARRHVHWLRYGDAPTPPVIENELLEQAAAHACSRALKILLEDLKARSPPWTALHDERMEEVLAFMTTAIMEHATVAHCGTHYRFAIDVVKAAAARGHLCAVQWLLPRSAQESGQIDLLQHTADDRRSLINESLWSAATARQLHVVNWIVHTFPHLDCVLPFDEELQSVAWIARDESDPTWNEYCSATSKHGVSSCYGDTYAAGESFTNRMTNLPLADGFARDGDLTTLEKIYAKSNYRHLIGTRAIVQAASRGHLHVAQWLYERFPHALSVECSTAASRHGHVAILQWMQQQHYDLSKCGASIVCEAVRYGHVHVLKWFASLDDAARIAVLYGSVPIAVQHGHVDVVKFLHEDCELVLEMDEVLEALTICPNVEMYANVLDQVGPLPDEQQFLGTVITRDTPLEVVQYLVLTRGLWSRETLTVAICCGNLAASQFFYTQAHARAKDLDTTLGDQLDLPSIWLDRVWNGPLAEWLATLPELFPARIPTTSSLDAYLTSPERKQVLLVCIRHRLDECRAVAWLPTWAVRIHSFDVFEQLAASGHPHLRNAETFQSILQYTRDARFLLKVLPVRIELCEDVVAWATKFGMVPVLDRVLDGEEEDMQHHFLDCIMRQGGFSGHVELVDRLLERSDRRGVATSTIIQVITMDAACHSHTYTLESLARRQFLEGLTAQEVDKIATKAAEHRQVRSLEWLIDNLPVSVEVVATALLKAVGSHHTEIVELLTRRYQPWELPMSVDGRCAVRAFLQRNRRGETENAVMVDEESNHDEDTAGGTKRSRHKY